MTQALALFYRQLAIPLGAGGAIIEAVSALALRGDTLNRSSWPLNLARFRGSPLTLGRQPSSSPRH